MKLSWLGPRHKTTKNIDSRQIFTMQQSNEQSLVTRCSATACVGQSVTNRQLSYLATLRDRIPSSWKCFTLCNFLKWQYPFSASRANIIRILNEIYPTAAQIPHQVNTGDSHTTLKGDALDVKALMFEFNHPSEPILKVFTNTNTYYLSATVRKPPETSRVVHGQFDELESTVSSFRDFNMRVPGQSDVETLSGGSLEDISDITLADQHARTYRIGPKSNTMTVPPANDKAVITGKKYATGLPLVHLPVTEDRRIRNRQYSFISVNIRTPNHTGIVLLRSFRLTREHMATEFSCTVCEKVFKVDQAVVILPCGHLFHKSCILLHLSRTSEHCPACGLDITKPDHPILSDVSISNAERTSVTLSEDDDTLCTVWVPRNLPCHAICMRNPIYKLFNRMMKTDITGITSFVIDLNTE